MADARLGHGPLSARAAGSSLEQRGAVEDERRKAGKKKKIHTGRRQFPCLDTDSMTGSLVPGPPA